MFTRLKVPALAVAARGLLTMGMLSAAVSGGLILTIVGGYIGHMDTGDQAGAALARIIRES